MAVNSFGLLLGSLLLLLQSCARGLDTSTFKRPAEGLLANVSAIRAKCSYPFNGGTEFKGTRACFQWLEKNEQEYLKTPEELGIAPVNTSEPLIVHTGWQRDRVVLAQAHAGHRKQQQQLAWGASEHSQCNCAWP